MAVITSGLVFYGCTGEREVRARALFFTSYFSSSRTPRVSPLVASISDHQSRLYYYFFFPQSALISRATQEIKSPPFSQLSTPSLVPSPFYSFFSSPLQFTLAIFFLQVFFLSCFPAALSPPPPQTPERHKHPKRRAPFLALHQLRGAAVPPLSAL